MKQGLTYRELSVKVHQEAATRCDLYVPTGEMHLTSDGVGSRLATPCGHFGMKETAHQHLAELSGIDRRYYQKMRVEAPFLLDRNVNHWLANSPSRQRMIRTLNSDTNSQVRAIVSSRYATLDNDALLRAVEPVMDELDLDVESCDVNDEKLTIKLSSPRLTGDVQVGDLVQVGIVIRNSEVRLSAVEVDWFVKRLVCMNGLIINGPANRVVSRRHIGKDWDASHRKSLGSGATSSLPQFFGPVPDNEDRQDWEKTIWSDLQSSLRESLESSAFTGIMERLTATTKLRAGIAPDRVVERVGNAFNLDQDEQKSVLHHLTEDEDSIRHGVTLWGILNAVTRTAEDSAAYHRATQLEELGGKLVRLSPSEWHRLIGPN